MGDIIRKIKGTEDIMPKDVYKWQFVEDVMRQQAESFGYKEVRTPVFEQTSLFSRGVGETTDVVQKEMYTFSTKGDASITLRPEGTAGAARAFLEHGVQNDGLPSKQYYLTFENPFCCSDCQYTIICIARPIREQREILCLYIVEFIYTSHNVPYNTSYHNFYLITLFEHEHSISGYFNDSIYLLILGWLIG